jgi:hypothetical protein
MQTSAFNKQQISRLSQWKTVYANAWLTDNDWVVFKFLIEQNAATLAVLLFPAT